MKTFPLFFRVLILTFVFSAAALPGVSAQDWAKERLNKSPRHREYVDIKSGDRTIKAFVVYPESKNKTPVVLVIHEIFGLTDWVKSLCDQLAENGVIAICPDLLSGQTYADIDGAVKAISALPKQQVKADLDATADYALKIPACNGSLAVCGFCWGGGTTFTYASLNPKIKAAYVFYGTGPEKTEDASGIQCPVYGFYAEADARVTSTVVKSIELMKPAGKIFEPVTYSGASHGFMREGEGPDASDANRKARDDAWKRWKSLLEKLKAS